MKNLSMKKSKRSDVRNVQRTSAVTQIQLAHLMPAHALPVSVSFHFNSDRFGFKVTATHHGVQRSSHHSLEFRGRQPLI